MNHTPDQYNRQKDIQACSTTADVLSRVRISQVYTTLTGIEPRRTGRDTWRASVPGGDSRDRISGDDSRNVFHDFVDDSGGGLLDMVQRFRGGSRADALRWAADLAGVPMADTPLSAEDRERWAAERRELERTLPTARYWQRGVIGLTEELLHVLKTALVDPMLPQPGVGEIQTTEGALSRLKRLDGAALVAEYQWWLAHHAGMTAGLVRWARQRERAERRALLAYLHATDPARAAA